MSNLPPIDDAQSNWVEYVVESFTSDAALLRMSADIVALKGQIDGLTSFLSSQTQELSRQERVLEETRVKYDKLCSDYKTRMRDVLIHK